MDYQDERIIYAAFDVSEVEAITLDAFGDPDRSAILTGSFVAETAPVAIPVEAKILGLTVDLLVEDRCEVAAVRDVEVLLHRDLERDDISNSSHARRDPWPLQRERRAYGGGLWDQMWRPEDFCSPITLGLTVGSDCIHSQPLVHGGYLAIRYGIAVSAADHPFALSTLPPVPGGVLSGVIVRVSGFSTSDLLRAEPIGEMVGGFLRLTDTSGIRDSITESHAYTMKLAAALDAAIAKGWYVTANPLASDYTFWNVPSSEEASRLLLSCGLEPQHFSVITDPEKYAESPPVALPDFSPLYRQRRQDPPTPSNN